MSAILSVGRTTQRTEQATRSTTWPGSPPHKTPTKEEVVALLKRIVRPIRRRFPHTAVIFRADSHHTKPAVLDWLEANNVR